MILNIDDINTYLAKEEEGNISILQKIKLHKPTGVFFTANLNSDTNEFLYFTIGAIVENNNIQDKKIFEGKTSLSFFEAVKYFESLIENRTEQPKNDGQNESIGTFFFVKKSDSFVILDNSNVGQIIIELEDLEKVFSPPQKKPYGRLNMLAVDKSQYDVIHAKFALKFDEKLTNDYIDYENLAEGDAFAYRMTPYQNNDSGDTDNSTPEPVNDNQLSLDQIEEEDIDKMKGEPNQEPNDNDNQNEPNDENGEPGDENGEPGDENGEPGDENGEPGDSGDSGQDIEPGDSTHTSRHIKVQPAQSNELIPLLNKLFNTNDIAYKFKTPARLINNLSVLSESELKNQFYNTLGINESMSKKHFLDFVRQETGTLFE